MKQAKTNKNQTILKNGPKKTCLKIHEIGQKKLRHFIISVYKPPPTAPPPCGWPLKMISNDCLCPKTFIWTPEPCFQNAQKLSWNFTP